MVSVKAIQIISPVNKRLKLQIDDLIAILEADNIKDRNVVVSIAGAFRKGKSFLLNFFLRYLYAQYKKFDVSNWLGEGQSIGEHHGFKSKGGRKPETTGIWMSSEIFTHDFENGEKVAIILLDTQGIFDNQSSMQYCTATFTISMMLASVQCYNVSQNIQEDDLQHLELFTEYGRLAMEQSHEKPFHKLLFIVRDWEYAEDHPYGYAKEVIDEDLHENDDQVIEMQELRSRIKSSFDDINAFVMPHPGKKVSQAKHFDGKLSSIEPEFIECVKELVPSLFAPGNLVPKKIGGRKVKARDLVTYLENYVSVFNGRDLPEPKTVLMSTAATSNFLLSHECLNEYVDSMQKCVNEKSANQDEPYFNQFDLQEVHEAAKEKSLSLFNGSRKLGGEKMVDGFRKELTNQINGKYKLFKIENEYKQRQFYALAKAEIHGVYMDCLKLYVDSMQRSFGEVDEYLSAQDLQQIQDNAASESIQKFKRAHKRGGDRLIEMFTNTLLNGIDIKYMHFSMENDRKRAFVEDAAARTKMEARAEAAEKVAVEARADMKNMMLYHECLNLYKTRMQVSMNEVIDFYIQVTLDALHASAKRDCLSRFETNRESGGQELMLETRLENDIDTNFVYIEQQNDRKRKDVVAAGVKKKLE